MKIKSLKLKNFMGIKSLELNLDGKNANIYGDNATGKTTCFTAFTWLLFDKDSQNRKNFEIKTLNPNGEPEHGLEHTVEAELELSDNESLTLKKVFSEKWTKKRGDSIAEFTGHTTDYYINGVPVQKKEYDAKIAEIADEQIFRLLTDPTYFNEQLHWQDRRNLLLEVCGNVSDDEVIQSKSSLNELTKIIGNRTIEQHRKVIQARLSEINKELQKIPVRIDEVNLNIPNMENIPNEKDIRDCISKLRKDMDDKQQELAQAKAGGKIAEYTKQLKAIEIEMLDLKNKHQIAINSMVSSKRMELIKLQSEIFKLRYEVDNKNREIQDKTTEIKSLDTKIDLLRYSWREEHSKTFECNQGETCPTCGQPLPLEYLQDVRDKALAQFNQNKAEMLEAINTDGQKLKCLRNSIEADINQLQDEIESMKIALHGLEQKESILKADIDAIVNNSQPVELTSNYIKLNEEYEAIQRNIDNIKESNSLAIANIQSEINNIEGLIEEYQKSLTKLETYKNCLKRIDELKATEKKLAAEYEELERQLYLTEEFMRTKVRILDDKINSKFKLARFKMFNVLINGGIEECCETIYNGVPYSDLNKGAKIQIGLDIIRTLQDHYNFSCPVWIDNRESIIKIPEMDCQIISLIVNGDDKKLRIEIIEKQNKEDIL